MRSEIGPYLFCDEPAPLYFVSNPKKIRCVKFPDYIFQFFKVFFDFIIMIYPRIVYIPDSVFKISATLSLKTCVIQLSLNIESGIMEEK